MIFNCVICGKPSRESHSHEPMPREYGFIEILRPNKYGSSSGYSACSFKCAAMLFKIVSGGPETKAQGKLSRQWKCGQCGSILVAHLFEDFKSQCEAVPCSVPRFHDPSDDSYHCFCSDTCMLRFLTKTEIQITA